MQMQHNPQWYIAALAMTLLIQDPAVVFAQRAQDDVERVEYHDAGTAAESRPRQSAVPGHSRPDIRTP